jgi:hypothetical protein
MIVDGATVAAASLAPGVRDLRVLLLAFYPDAEIAELDVTADDAPPMVAEVNHGVWIAPCACRSPGDPSPGCLVWVSIPFGWCIRCGNAVAGGRWRRVVLPPDDERAAIEAALAARPEIGTRNWAPGETVADLHADNAAHGLEVA